MLSRKRELRLIVALGLGDAALCDGEVLWVNLDADEVPAGFDAGDARGAAAHERVKDGAAFRAGFLYQPSRDPEWFRRRMVEAVRNNSA